MADAGSLTSPNKETITLRLPSGEMVDAVVPAGMSDSEVRDLMRMKRPDLAGPPRTAGAPPNAVVPGVSPPPVEGVDVFGSNTPPPKGQMAKQTKPSPAVGAVTMAGAGALGVGAIPGVPKVARAAVKMAPYALASEAISQARHIPVVGKFIPPYSEMLPYFMGGHGEAAEAKPKVGGPEPIPEPPPSSGVTPPPSKTALSRTLDEQLREGLGNKPVQPGVKMRDQLKVGSPELPEGHLGVESSAMDSYKYDPAAREFHVNKGGKVYTYGDVSPEQAKAFEAAPSKGKAWQDIRNSSPLTGKNGTPVKPTSPHIAGPSDLTGVLTESVEQAKKKKAAGGNVK